MRWMTNFGNRLMSALGNDGAIRNVQSDIDRRAAIVAHLEVLAARLALVDAVPSGAMAGAVRPEAA